MNKLLAPACLALLGLLLVSATSRAAPKAATPSFGYAAIALQPSHKNIQSDAFMQVAGRIKHKGTSTQDLVLFGAVSNPDSGAAPGWNRFTMICKDPDGPGAKYEVEAKLRYVDDSGHVETVVEIDSNSLLEAGFGKVNSPTFRHEFDFIDRYYYFEAVVRRSDTGALPEIGGLNLWRDV